jgi:5-formyltetrahydrofolate cyclo-ligase
MGRMASDKDLLRNQLKHKRRSIGPEEAAVLSHKIIGKVIRQFDWSSVQSLHVYQPLLHHREVDTRPLVKKLRSDYPEMKIAIWEDFFGAHAALWLTPDAGRAIPKNFQFEMIIVPVIGFNDECHRIGFGGGFYDRFLSVQAKAVTVGLCYENGHVDFASEGHDIPLDHIVTESAVYSRQSPPSKK